MSPVYSPILELRDVEFSYSRERFMEGLNVSVGEADFLGLLGANGSGKSTLLKLLAGILRPTRGTVALWARELASYRNRDRAKLVSYLPQALDKGAPFSVAELVGMGLYPYERPAGMGVEEALGMVGLREKGRSLLRQLSGGERRRAFIAMTLLQGAGILLMDEPLANLDIRYQLEIVRLLRELNAGRKIAVVMALHDINMALRFDRLVLIKEGRVLASGPPVEVLRPELLMEAFGIEIRLRRNGGESYISFEGSGSPS